MKAEWSNVTALKNNTIDLIHKLRTFQEDIKDNKWLQKIISTFKVILISSLAQYSNCITSF